VELEWEANDGEIHLRGVVHPRPICCKVGCRFTHWDGWGGTGGWAGALVNCAR